MFRLGCSRLAAFVLAGVLCVCAGGSVPSARAQLSDIEREWRVLQQAQAAHARGRAAAERGDRDTALSELGAAAERYQQLLEQNPLRRDLYGPLADTLILRNNAAAAYALLSQQIRNGNKEVSVRIQLVRALHGMRRHRHAFDEAQKLVQSDSRNPLLQALLGAAAAAAGESALAINVLSQVLARPPAKSALAEAGLSLTALRLLRARLLIAGNRLSEAEAELGELGRAQQPEALLLLGQISAESGKLDEALKLLRRCLAVLPADAATLKSQATVLLGRVLAKAGQGKEALSVLRQAGDDGAALMELAHIYMAESPPNAAAALQAVERAVQIDPRDPRICMEHADLLARARRKEEAQEAQERCSTLLPPAGAQAAQELLLLHADIELRLGHLERAIADLRKALDADAGSVLIKGRLVQALLRRGLDQLQTPPPSGLSLLDLEEASKLSPSPLTSHALAIGLLAAGKPKDAAALLLPLCQSNAGGGKGPSDPRLLLAYARALRDSGQAALALPVLQSAESLLPSDAGDGAAVLRAALRQEQANTFLALGRPLEALKLVEGNDPVVQRARAQALLAAVRAFYSAAAGRGAPSAGNKPTRGLLPPLRGPTTPVLEPLPIPPLRGLADLADSAALSSSAQGLSEERQVLTYAQAALRLGTLSLSERGEAMLYQVTALVHGGQYALGQRLLAEIASQIDLATLDGLLGPGGFLSLKAQVTLRSGDFYQGSALALQALPLLKQPNQAKTLQNMLAVSNTNKAIEMLERSEVERANTLLRNAWTQTRTASVEVQNRANYNLAVLQLYRGRLEDARAALSHIDPQTLPEVWLGLGSYHDRIGDGRTALDMYRRYMQATEPTDPQLPRVRQWVDVLERFGEAGQP